MKHLAKESIIGQNRDERIICFSNSAADFQRLSIRIALAIRQQNAVRIFAYSSTLEQLNKNSGSRLKTEKRKDKEK